MKTRSRRSMVLLALAVLLAAVTMGNISLCDLVVLGAPDDADTLRVIVVAGETAPRINEWNDIYEDVYRFSLCPPGDVAGVYTVIYRDESATTTDQVSVDLVTSPNTPPGHYLLGYEKATVEPLYPFFATGTIDLTVTPGTTLAACFNPFTEVIYANTPTYFSAGCSEGAIVLYKWWFDYNGNPASTPTTTTTISTVQGSLPAGTRVVRLVVRNANGQEAEIAHTYPVGNHP